jgi:hypothetical protein
MKDSPWSTSQIHAPVISLSLYETLFVFLKPPFLFLIFYALALFLLPFLLAADFLCYIFCRQNLTLSAVFLQKYFFYSASLKILSNSIRQFEKMWSQTGKSRLGIYLTHRRLRQRRLRQRRVRIPCDKDTVDLQSLV